MATTETVRIRRLERGVAETVEDTVVVTDDGIENFTASAPLELDDVEAMMRTGGILQKWPGALLE